MSNSYAFHLIDGKVTHTRGPVGASVPISSKKESKEFTMFGIENLRFKGLKLPYSLPLCLTIREHKKHDMEYVIKARGRSPGIFWPAII